MLKPKTRLYGGICQVSGAAGAVITIALRGDPSATVTAATGVTFSIDGLDLSQLQVAISAGAPSLTIIGSIGKVVE